MSGSPEQRREYYQRNREQILAAQREYRAANREQIRVRAREDYQRNRGQRREHELARGREYRAANRGQRNAKNRERYAANREQVRERYARNREQRLAQRLYANHGIWPDQWAAMWDAQNGRCYLCGKPLDPDNAALDHDHSCCPKNKSCQVCRRGLAHGGCNTAIGFFLDDPDLMERAAAELRAAKQRVEQRKAAAPAPQDSLFPDLLGEIRG